MLAQNVICRRVPYISIATDCGGIFQEIHNINKTRFVICNIENTLSFSELTPLSMFNDVCNVNATKVVRTSELKYEGKMFNAVSELFKAKGYCEIMNKRLDMLDFVISKPNKFYLQFHNNIKWYFNTNTNQWYSKYGKNAYHIKYIEEMEEFVTITDWEYGCCDFVVKKINIFTRLFRSLWHE